MREVGKAILLTLFSLITWPLMISYLLWEACRLIYFINLEKKKNTVVDSSWINEWQKLKEKIKSTSAVINDCGNVAPKLTKQEKLVVKKDSWLRPEDDN